MSDCGNRIKITISNTNRKRIALMDSKIIPELPPNLLHQVFDQLAAAVILLDGEGKILLANAVAERLLNISEASALNQSNEQILKIYSLDNPDQRLLFPIQTILNQGVSIERLNHAILVDGQGRSVQVECSLLPFKYRNDNGALLILQELPTPHHPIKRSSSPKRGCKP